MPTHLQFDFSKGLPQDLWKSLEMELKSSAAPSDLVQRWKAKEPRLGDLALEAGFFDLACLLGCSHPLFQMKALFHSGQKLLSEQIMENLSCGSAEKRLCHIFLLRTAGQAQEAVRLYKGEMAQTLSELKGSLALEARLQWALVFYQLEKWEEVTALYKSCYEAAEQEGLSSYKAISSFNLATVYQNQKQKLEAKTWLWRAEAELQNYHLDNLENSRNLFELQCDLQELNDQGVLEKAPLFLEKKNLSPQQRLRGLQTLAEAQTEWGQVLDAEMTLSQARKLIQKNHLDQYRSTQAVLELNLASIVHRPCRFQIRVRLEQQSLHLDEQAALARWAFRMNDLPRTLRLTSTLQAASADSAAYEDLFVLLSNRLEQPGSRARTIEHQVYKCWLSKQWKALEYLNTHLEIENSRSPWKQVLQQLCSVVLAWIGDDRALCQESCEKGFVLSSESGLERLESLFVHLNQVLQLQLPLKINHELSPEELAFYDSLTAKLTAQRRALGRQSSGEKGVLEAGAIHDSDLIFDEDKSEVLWRGQVISLQSQPVLLRIVKNLFLSSAGLSKEKLIREVWGLDYHPLHHDPMIYSAIGRLRDLMPIECQDGLYKIPGSLKWVHLSQNKESVLKISDRQKEIFKLLDQMENLSRRDLVERLKLSERTALRELTQLVRMGLLTQNGAGRGVYYSRWSQGA
jgi:hypothetical protein